jgi:putative isomerase
MKKAMIIRTILLIFCLLSVLGTLRAQEQNAAEMAKMRTLVRTEDPQINDITEKIFAQCIFSKLFDPLPPGLPNKWFSPGGGYVGQWVWDTQFVLAAYAPMGEDAIIRGVYDNYWQTVAKNPEAPIGSYRYGMVPIFLKGWPPRGFSQIPILAWGMLQVYRQNGDRELLKTSLPYLLAFDKWYSTERDVDNDGLIEFGAYKPSGNTSMVQTARYETFDYFPPMDSMKMTKHPTRAEGGEWYGNVEGVEQTCFLLMSEQALVEIAGELGEKEIAKQYKEIISHRIAAIQKKMWDPKKKFFFSLDRDSDRPIDVRSIQGFLTLCCGAATKKQAKLLVAELTDTTMWWCKYPVPTVALNDPKFDSKGFWRGDMWPVTTYLVAYGLNRYGYHNEARKLTEKMVELFARNGINERYNGVTGKPLGVQGLGMSCSVWSMIVENYYGITNDYQTICVPPNAKGRHLKLGQLEVNYVRDDQVEVSTGFDRKIKVVFPGTHKKLRVTLNSGDAELPVAIISSSSASVEFKAESNKKYLIQTI